MKYPWYIELLQTDNLEQGDIFYNCTVLEPSLQNSDRGDTISVRMIKLDVIILSQSCDLGHGKIRNVMVCPLSKLSKHLLENFESNGERKGHVKKLKRGEELRYHILNKQAPIIDDFLVIDLKNAFGITFEYLEELRKKQEKNVRLLPPYREHLSQAFARIFMRIGLPDDISDLELESITSNLKVAQ
jgi:hypothetical protein